MNGRWAEALRLSREIEEAGSNEAADHVRQLLHDEFERIGLRFRVTKGGFIERYTRNDLALHLHGAIGLPEPRVGTNGEFCAVIEIRSDEMSLSSSFREYGLLEVETQDGHIQVPMFVDVGECVEETEHEVRRLHIPSVIRLQSLDECKRSWGETRPRLATKLVLGNMVSEPSGAASANRELDLVVGGDGSFPVVHLDKIEKQVIQGGPNLIQQLSNENRNINGGLLFNYGCFFTVRLRDDFIRVVVGVFGDTRVDFCRVVPCPDEFSLNDEALGMRSRLPSRC